MIPLLGEYPSPAPSLRGGRPLGKPGILVVLGHLLNSPPRGVSDLPPSLPVVPWGPVTKTVLGLVIVLARIVRRRYFSILMNKFYIILPICGLLVSDVLHARGGGGGGGFRGGMGEGEFREGGEHFEDEGEMGSSARERSWGDEGAGVDEGGRGAGDYQVEEGDKSADVDVRNEGDGFDNVNVRTENGRDYDTTVAGPDGYRAGYVWRNGGYVEVNCEAWTPYVAPFGAWAGWNIITQPDFVQYPVYATYPVETAVQVALQNLGLYTGAIDGQVSSCSAALEQYQQQNNLPVTGTITPDLLSRLGIEVSQ